MTAPLCGGPQKILLDWREKATVLVVASLAVSPYCEGFQFFAYFKNSEFSLIMHVSESGPEVGFGETAIDLLQARFWITSELPTNRPECEEYPPDLDPLWL